ncbi:hypothetical protein CYMTET_23914 [Cymbomonas tetramitiformis]|uniref:Uncharacterized protein n=1 Tax=Cymbomonas tetramitiformis TaxID=36881 RepID=A0AAE0FXJ3_9CHLO|nr:hypothetical protein CYMTET_23914 [Cymbomonas tetramitiformis]
MLGNDSAQPSGELSYSSEERHQKSVQAMVETAMLAACAGLAYYLGTVLRLESHLGAFLPLPVVLAGARWDSRVAAKTLTVTAILLSILTGWQRALTYVLMHGAMGITLAVLWHRGATWSVTIPVASLVRSMGIMASLVGKQKEEGRLAASVLRMRCFCTSARDGV